MSKPYTITKYGDKRTRVKRLSKGTKLTNVLGGDAYLTEDCEVDVVDIYTSNYGWEHHETKWDTLRPVRPKGPGFWTRLWARLTRKTPLPQARLLKDSNA